MARSKRIPRPSAIRGLAHAPGMSDPLILAQRPRLAPDVSRSMHRIDEFDLQRDWEARIDAGLIEVSR